MWIACRDLRSSAMFCGSGRAKPRFYRFPQILPGRGVRGVAPHLTSAWRAGQASIRRSEAGRSRSSTQLLGSGGNRRMRPKGSVIHDASQEIRLVGDLLGLGESGFAHEIEDDVMGARAMARMKRTGDKAV